MALLTCRRCGLELEIQGNFLQIENCPRCRVRDGSATAMVLSSGPVRGWGPEPPESTAEVFAARERR